MIEKELYIDVLEYLQDGGNWSQKLEIVEINSYKEIGNFIINDMLEKIPHTDNMKIKQIVCMYLNYSQEQYSKLHYDDLCVLICEKVIRFKTYPTDEYQKILHNYSEIKNKYLGVITEIENEENRINELIKIDEAHPQLCGSLIKKQNTIRSYSKYNKSILKDLKKIEDEYNVLYDLIQENYVYCEMLKYAKSKLVTRFQETILGESEENVLPSLRKMAVELAKEDNEEIKNYKRDFVDDNTYLESWKNAVQSIYKPFFMIKMRKFIDDIEAFYYQECNSTTIMANACGPCIGQWKRHTDDPTRKNSIVTSFNRNFAKRADGNPNTYAFVASPELTMALTIAGDLCFNPLKDRLVNHDGEKVKLSEPVGDELPMRGFTPGNVGYIAPGGAKTEIKVKSDSQRLQLLTPFPAWDGTDLLNMPLLIKAQGKCTTDHISMAGPWLRFRGHLENISDNMLMGAVNVFNGETNKVWNRSTNTYGTVSGTAKMYKSEGISSIVVAEENYGEGSSREHAAMEPRFLNVRVILAKSFARIHETNLKKQGMLAITFVDKADYDKIQEHDVLSVTGLVDFMPGHNLTVVLHHEDGTKESFEVQHTYNEQQIGWFRAGSALNAR